MDLTYAVADLHGAYDLLDRALAAVARHGAGRPDGARRVVFLGDTIDRGPDSGRIVARLIDGPPPAWQWLCLKGNHEQMMVDVCDGRQPFGWWIDNGGDATLRSYDAPARLDALAALPDAHLAWARGLPPLAVDRHRVFVHAGLDAALPLEAQREHDLLWSRVPNRLGYQGRFVVHGHTPHPDGPLREGQSLNLDTLAWMTGRLVVGVFDDDLPGGPVENLEVRR